MTTALSFNLLVNTRVVHRTVKRKRKEKKEKERKCDRVVCCEKDVS